MIPNQIRKQAAEADAMIQQLAREGARRARAKGGRPKVEKRPKPTIFFVAESEGEAAALVTAYMDAVGPRVRGNKRHGATDFYAGLVRCFSRLQRAGVTLPRGGSLSQRACALGLADVLIAHGYVLPADAGRLLKNGEFRHRVGHKLARVFDVVADAVEKNTPQ